jgi:hypothetical protein
MAIDEEAASRCTSSKGTHVREEANNIGTTIKDCWVCEKLRQHCGNQSGPSQNRSNQIIHAKSCHVMQTILKGNKNICMTFNLN